jgi:hypothetical protein
MNAKEEMMWNFNIRNREEIEELEKQTGVLKNKLQEHFNNL